MKKAIKLLILFILSSAAIFVPDLIESKSAGFENFRECSAQCSGLSGNMKLNCIETCARVSRKYSGRNGPKNSKFKKCDDVCNSFKGIDNVKCIRICMEKIKEMENPGNPGKSNSDSPCLSRCKVFNEPMKSRCLQRCGRESKPFRKRSVW